MTYKCNISKIKISKIKYEFQFPDKNLVLLKPLTVCNLACKYCYYEINSNLRSKKFANLDNIFKAINTINLKSNDYIFLSGGEFLLHPQYLEIVRFLKNKAFIILTTNGIDLYKHQKVLVEVDAVQVTLDSIKSRYHDEFRGKQEETINSLKELTQNEINTSILVVLSKKNIAEFDHILSFSIENNVNSIFIQLLWLPKSHQLYNSLVLDEDDIEAYLKIKNNLIKSNNKINIPQNFYLNLLQQAIKDDLKDYAVINCFGMDNVLVIDPYGNINHCLPYDFINLKNSNDYPNTQSRGLPFKNRICNYFSSECICFFGHITMDYKKR